MPTPEPTATPTPAPLTSAQIFESVSPSIVFIKTVANKGSGVLIEGGYVVTNAHVVWPYATVRVVFPDGSEFLEVPVKGLDLLADLAVLGPIDPPTGALELVDGESLPIGSETFVIGYPKVTEEFPRPTIVRGLLSRVVEMEFVGITNLQIDAALAPGHSGSALVSDRGEVIGITGFAITDANFGVATSSGDILPRVRQLIAGEDPSQLGDRRVPLEGAALRHEIALENLWAQGSYVIDELPGSVIDIDFKGDQGGELAIVNSFSSLLLYLDSGNTGAATGSFAVEYRGPNFLIVQRWAETPSKFTLTSSHRLIPIHDPDDGRQIQVGESVLGNMDFPGDTDYYLVDLNEGQTIEVAVSSILVNSFLTIYYEGAGFEQMIVDHNSGGGFFRQDSKIAYRAPHMGRYFVVVQDAALDAPGGYAVAVEPANPDATLTQTTAASLFPDSDPESTPSTSSEFGLAELRSAFAELPGSFQEFDSAVFGDLITVLNLEGYVSDVLVLAELAPFQLIIAVGGELTDLERIELDAELSSGTLLDAIVRSLVGETDQGEQDLEVLGSGLLQSSAVGDNSFGAYLDISGEAGPLRVELIKFRRGNLFGSVYSFAGIEPLVSVEELARMLDAKMKEVISAR